MVHAPFVLCSLFTYLFSFVPSVLQSPEAFHATAAPAKTGF
jgi:hypothetical protein